MKKKRIIFLFLQLFFYAASYSQKLIQEDFTDGFFDNFGAGAGGQNWQLYGPGTAFRSTNSRSFPFALSNRVQAGGAGWADGAQWRIWNDVDSDGKFDDDEMNYFGIHKYNDIVLCRFTTFSDYCYRNNQAGVEVAFLEWRNVLDYGTPHFGHDQSWETMNCYYTTPGNGGSPNQLETNIENTVPAGAGSIAGYARAHKNTWYNATDLDNTQTSLVIWRNQKAQNKCNVEQWGQLNAGDFMVDTTMQALLDPARDSSLFSYIQVTFFRGIPTLPGSQFVLRGGVPFNQAQIGITNLEIGITKRADFNLDYTVDIKDADTLVKYLGYSSGLSLLTGDATNDDIMNIHDANELIGFWDTLWTPAMTASGNYNSLTGEISLSMNDVSYWHVEGPSGIFMSGTSADFTGFTTIATNDSASFIGGFTTGIFNNITNVNIGAVAATGFLPSDLFLVVNYKGSNLPQGFKIPLNGFQFILPVKIKNFSVRILNEKPTLSWTIENEINFDRYEIEKSANGKDFNPVGTVKGDNTINKTKQYQFIDNYAIRNSSLFYRLRLIDISGIVKYSNIINLFSSKRKNKLVISPNPATNKATLHFEATEKGTGRLVITNILGKTVMEKAIQLLRGKNTVEIPDCYQLHNGVYQVNVHTSKEIITEKLIISK